MSRLEGAWSPETLVRVIGVYQQQQISQNIRKNADLHGLVRDIDPICSVTTSPIPDAVTKDEATATRMNFMDAAGNLQPLLSIFQFLTGDIFDDGKGQKYILLAQPCDLMVRSKGNRRSKAR